MITMGKPVKHRAKLGRSLSGGVFTKRWFKADNITDMESCFMLLDSDILKSVINLIGGCPKC